jgi:hypothetical protein
MADTSRAAAVLREHGVPLAVDAVINILLPYLIYSYESPRIGEVHALIASSAPPIVWSLAEFARKRRVDALSLLVLGGIALSLLAFVGGGSARLLQLREKLVTGAIGLVFLVSVAIGRPLIYHLARAGSLRRASPEAARMEQLRDDPMFRRSMNVMTAVWGLGLLADVAISAVLVFTMSIKEYLIFNPLFGYAVLGGLGVWTFWYSRRRREMGDAARARGGAPSDALAGPSWKVSDKEG